MMFSGSIRFWLADRDCCRASTTVVGFLSLVTALLNLTHY